MSKTNPLVELHRFGQSFWFDNIHRGALLSGELERLVREDGLRGLTSNPAIFEKAMSSPEYAAGVAALVRCGFDAKGIYEQLALRDIREAADVLLPVYRASEGRDGFVSLEVSPTLARDTQGTLAEARRLWAALGRENAMIKVPGTPEGVPAIETLLSEGINVNVTLLFSRAAYEEVADAYLRGLEARAKKGLDVSRVASVASFFVSRIDSSVDAQLEKMLAAADNLTERFLLRGLLGKVAVANAKLAYQHYKELLASPRWKALVEKGARPQRLLWASTGTKNPRYSDCLYVDELVGVDTVNTMPPATVDAFRHHGRTRNALEEGIVEAKETLAVAEQVGISLDQVTGQLLEDGVVLFAQAFEKLLAAVAAKAEKVKAEPPRLNGLELSLPGELQKEVDAAVQQWDREHKVERLWRKDATVWTGKDEGKWLGWLDIVGRQRLDTARFEKWAQEVKAAKLSHVVLLGMGGSSLFPEVLARTFGKQAGFPELLVLDSTDPDQVKAVEQRVNLASSFFIVASKSGSTLEPNLFKDYFFERVREAVGAEVGKRFVAITDPGSSMQKVAERDGFGHLFFGLPSIGGRFSALSDFGMVPAAAMGLDVAAFLENADRMVQMCSAFVPAAKNPGVVLGAALGVLAGRGRDKVTVVTSPALRSLGSWMEQLLAESTGKVGKALVPVDLEPLAVPEKYGKDRVFVRIRLTSESEPQVDSTLAALAKAGHPVLTIDLAQRLDLAQELFRWEVATAVAGSLLGVHPFDQPDVEAAKVAARKLTDAVEKTGALPPETPCFEAGALRLFADAANAAAISKGEASVAGRLKAHLGRVKAGDYVGLLAFLEMNAANEASLGRLREKLRDALSVATTVGFGPRYLHSTGQAHKGGPDSGLFIVLTCDDEKELPVPHHNYGFGVVRTAQGRGDFDVLSERGRRVLRVHLGKNRAAAMAQLEEAFAQALAR